MPWRRRRRTSRARSSWSAMADYPRLGLSKRLKPWVVAPDAIATIRPGRCPRATTCVSSLSRYDVAEQVPGLAGPAHQLKLAQRTVVGWACINGDARQHHRVFQALQVGGLLHEVFAGEIVPALTQHLRDRVGQAKGGDIAGVLQIP